MTSQGSATTVPPAVSAFEAVSSALATQTYVFHVAADGVPSGIDPTAATSPPRSRAM
jgi:LPS sulfotransferase NodH